MKSSKTIRYKPWTFNEITYLEDNYQFMSNREMAKELNRTYEAVRAKTVELGLVRFRRWTEEDYDKFKSMYPYYSNEHLSELFNLERETIAKRAYEAGIKKMPNRYKVLKFGKLDFIGTRDEIVDRYEIVRSTFYAWTRGNNTYKLLKLEGEEYVDFCTRRERQNT